MDTVAFDRRRLTKMRKGTAYGLGRNDAGHPPSAVRPDARRRPRFYYVHSFPVSSAKIRGVVICEATHGYRFASGVACGNIIGVQFHPEKSHLHGMHTS